jgi:organic radical activating enzyme
VCELFSSIQGEGVLVGVRQAFVRFSECNLSCRYCDTQEAKAKSAKFSVKAEKVKVRANPVTPEELYEVLSLLPDPRHSVSITGGEPLLQDDFLAEFLPMLKGRGEEVYLETNATLPEALEKTIDWVDWVAADIKLESATCEPARYDDNRRFLEIALQKKVFVKLVVVKETTREELVEVGELVRGISGGILMIIQPVHPLGGAESPDGRRLIEMADELGEVIEKVRVIPQIHPILGWK